MSFYDDASLIFTPNGGKDTKAYSIKPTDGTGDFTFSRGSNLTATRVGADGLIEKGRENLLENSVWDGVTTDTNPTDWTKFLSGTGTFDVTATEGQIRFQTLDASSRAFIYSPTIGTNGIIVVSVYVDEVNTAMPLSQVISRAANATDLFAYEDGVEINYSDNVQAGKRYSVVFNKTGSTTFRFGVGTSTANLGDVTLSRPQIEVGLAATEYIASPVGSTGKAGLLEDEPRFDYSGDCPSLLLEPSRTNLVTQSEYFDEWGKIGSPTITQNYGTSPEGVQNSTRFQTTSDRIFMDVGSISADETFSIYMKGSGSLRIDLGGNNNFYPVLTSEWVRYDFTTTSAGSNANIQIRGNGSAVDVELYGAQYEQASYPTSYIPNHSGGTATRGADGFQNDTNTSPLGTIGQGTWFVEFQKLGIDDINQALYLVPTTNNTQQIRLHFDANNNARFRDARNGYATIGGGGDVTTSMAKMALSIDTTSGIAKVYVNGSQSGSDYTLQANPFEFSRIVAEGKGFILKQSLFFPTALSDAELATLTT